MKIVHFCLDTAPGTCPSQVMNALGTHDVSLPFIGDLNFNHLFKVLSKPELFLGMKYLSDQYREASHNSV